MKRPWFLRPVYLRGVRARTYWWGRDTVYRAKWWLPGAVCVVRNHTGLETSQFCSRCGWFLP